MVDGLAVTVTETTPPAAALPAAAARREKRGRAWLVASFVFCPCHLPVSMAVLGVLFGGSAFGALVGRNTLGVGLVFGVVYAVLLGVAFRHLRAATKGVDCSDGECVLPRNG